MSMTKEQRRQLEWGQYDAQRAERQLGYATDQVERLRYALIELYRHHYGRPDASVVEITKKLSLSPGDLWNEWDDEKRALLLSEGPV